MHGIGGEEQLVFHDTLIVTGNSELIPAVFTDFNDTEFPALIFTESNMGLSTFNDVNGEFTFLQRGKLLITATLNLQTSVGNSRVDVIPFLYDGSWNPLNGRIATLPVQGINQMVMVGIVSIVIEKDFKIMFQVCSPDNKGNFETTDLDGAVVPAAILDFLLFRR